jgi:sugar lactone lactonase YvrE
MLAWRVAMASVPELVADCRCAVGEGPVWDERDGALLWVDIVTGDVFHLAIASGELARMTLGQEVSAVLPRASGGYLLTLQDGVASVASIEQGAPVELIASVEPERTENRLNDAKCDPAGRLWGGTMARERTPGAGALYRLDADLALTRVVEGVTLSNGLGWSPDATRMYFVDSVPRTLDVFDFDLPSGTVSGRRRLIDVPAAQGSPDGLAVDAEGAIWLAVWGSGAVHRHAPDGELIEVFAMPHRDVASCCFGGADLSDLYVTTAWRELSEGERTKDPHAGGTYRLEAGVRGLPATLFAG